MNSEFERISKHIYTFDLDISIEAFVGRKRRTTKNFNQYRLWLYKGSNRITSNYKSIYMPVTCSFLHV